MNSLQTKLARKSANHEALAERVAKRPELLEEVFDGLHADKARIKFGCLKLLRLLSEKRPGVLYPDFDRFVELLDSENNILQWGGILIIGNLAVVDSDNKIERILSRFLRPISGPVMVTAANVVHAVGKIGQAKPHLADKIARALLKVELAHYSTAECHNVVLGHAVESLGLFFEHVSKTKPVVAFVKRQLGNRRNAVRRKAAAFLQKHDRAARLRPSPHRH